MVTRLTPRVLNYNDYHAFGMALPGRKYSAGSEYRYGFNGKENDAETGKQNYGMRIYDPRLSRFLSKDPIAARYAELTPYQFASNSPIEAVDLDGLEFHSGNGLFLSTVASRDPFIKKPSERLILGLYSKNAQNLHSILRNVKSLNDLYSVYTLENSDVQAPESKTKTVYYDRVWDKKGRPTGQQEKIAEINSTNNTLQGISGGIEMIVGGIGKIIDAERQQALQMVQGQAFEFRTSISIVDKAFSIEGFIPDQFKNDQQFASDLINFVFNNTANYERYGISKTANEAYAEIIKKLGKELYDNRDLILAGKYAVPRTEAKIIYTNKLDRQVSPPIIIDGVNLLLDSIKTYLDDIDNLQKKDPNADRNYEKLSPLQQ